MSETTNISWTDATWNPLIGCAKVSAGCVNCYAAALNDRYKWTTWGGSPRRSAVSTLYAPLKWNKKPWVCASCKSDHQHRFNCIPCATPSHRRRVFLGSLMDLFYERNQIEDVADILDVIRRCPDLDFLLLTKRPELWDVAIMRVVDSLPATSDLKLWTFGWMHETAIPHNIWLGGTVENQEQADKRIPELLRIPAKVRFLSVEPLLEEVNLEHWLIEGGGGGIDWCIVGGESGPNRRDCGVDAIVSVAEQCQAAGVPVFVKQDCASKSGQQGRIPAAIWNLKQLPVVTP
jgi:protein gp37